MRKMFLIMLAAIFTVDSNAQSDANCPEWVYKVRMVSMGQGAKKGEKGDPETKYQGQERSLDYLTEIPKP